MIANNPSPKRALIGLGQMRRKADELSRAAALVSEMNNSWSFASAVSASDLCQVLIDELSELQGLIYQELRVLEGKFGAGI